MIRRGFLDPEPRKDLTELARDGLAAHRLTRRANALLLLDDGMICEAIAKVLLLDDDTIRSWYRLYEQDGIEGLVSLDYEGGLPAERIAAGQAERLDHRDTAAGDARGWRHGRPGLVALLQRLSMEHRKPKMVSRKPNPEKQAAFIKAYEVLMNPWMPTKSCWAPKDTPSAVTQASRRQRLNIHGAIVLKTSQTRMLAAETVDAASTIKLTVALLAMYPRNRVIHLFLDNARYNHAKLVQAWLAQPGCRIKNPRHVQGLQRGDPVRREEVPRTGGSTATR